MLQLEKYAGKKSRFQCPSCGHRNAFARYVGEAGTYLADDVGRCNRESHCGYHRTPKEYYAANPVDRSNWTQMVKSKTPVKKPFDVIPTHYLEDSLRQSNAFIQFLLSRFDRDAVTNAIARYKIGTMDGFTVYWQLDRQGRIRTGKMIRYDATTGKRIKDGYCNDWVHARLKRDGKLSGNFNLEQCFFGSHLLTEEVKTVAIVEAEKTAVIASLCLPEYVWLSCGGKSILKAHKLQEFKHKRIVLFPDTDGFQQWEKEAKETRRSGLDVSNSNLLEQRLTSEEKEKGYDLADYLLHQPVISSERDKTEAKVCQHCKTRSMQHIEAGYFACLCGYQIVEPRSGFWTSLSSSVTSPNFQQ